jgi:hypothetical protein
MDHGLLVAHNEYSGITVIVRSNNYSSRNLAPLDDQKSAEASRSGDAKYVLRPWFPEAGVSGNLKQSWKLEIDG